MSLYQDFKSTALDNLKENAAYYHGHFLSYEYILRQIDLLADYLDKTMHFHPNNIVSICLNNSLLSFILIYACNKIGVIINMINPNLPSDQIYYFDTNLNSRMIFLEKSIYKNDLSTFKPIKNKIALIESKRRTIFQFIKDFKNTSKLKSGVPFKYKIKNKKLVGEQFQQDLPNAIAIIAPNEKFDEYPYQASFLNSNLHQGFINQKEIFLPTSNEEFLLCCGSLFSFPYFMSFYHTPICNKICVYLDDFLDKKMLQKMLKKHKITRFCGDFDSFSSLLDDKNNYLNIIIKGLKSAYIYNDFNRDIIGEKWYKNFNNIPLISTIGSVENCGVFLAKEYEKETIMSYGNFIGDFKGTIKTNSRKTNEGSLYLKSQSNMIGYFRDTNKNDEIIDEMLGIKTDLIGSIDELSNFHLISSQNIRSPYANDRPYLVSLKNILMTIPGIENVNIDMPENQRYTLNIHVKANQSETSRIGQEVSKYLDTQFKNKKTKCNIKINN